VLGSIGQPYLDEVFVGSALGSRLIRHGVSTPLRVRPCPTLDQAVISTTDPDLFDADERAAWTALRAATRLARFGCDAYAFAMVAAGRMDLAIDAGLKPWDVEAVVPVVRGAGGLVTDWCGAGMGTEGGQMAVAGDRALLDRALDLLSPAAK
jgi:fructose-1,6-bisphosphatase/inositol monophosphatase family enzyme